MRSQPAASSSHPQEDSKAEAPGEHESAVQAGLRVALLCDFLEEQWPSMDLVADRLLEQLRAEHAGEVAATAIRPRFQFQFGQVPEIGKRSVIYNLDRALNRYLYYPRLLRSSARGFDVFHIVDHSYAHLAVSLPAERTVITCHDLEIFRSLTDSSRDLRSILFRKVARRILTGLQKAARIVTVSAATRVELLARSWVPEERISVVPNGVDPSCSPNPDQAADSEAARLLGEASCQRVEILHVGSPVARKRIDFLLRGFASVRKTLPELRLIRVGGDFDRSQAALVSELGLHDAITVLPFLDRATLSAVYRRAALLLVTSEAEGFCLPVVEAMACGTPVVAGELPVLREVAGDAAEYYRLANVTACAETTIRLLQERALAPRDWEERRLRGLEQAALFSWRENARKMVALYRELGSVQ